jgi:hypothetical protein
MPSQKVACAMYTVQLLYVSYNEIVVATLRARCDRSWCSCWQLMEAIDGIGESDPFLA